MCFRQTGHRPPRHQEQEHPGEEQPRVLHRRLRPGRQVLQRHERDRRSSRGKLGRKPERHQEVHGPRDPEQHHQHAQLRRPQDGGHVRVRSGVVGDVETLHHR